MHNHVKQEKGKKKRGPDLMNRRVHRIGTNRAFKELMNTGSVYSWSHGITVAVAVVVVGGGGGVWFWNRRKMMKMVVMVDLILIC